MSTMWTLGANVVSQRRGPSSASRPWSLALALLLVGLISFAWPVKVACAHEYRPAVLVITTEATKDAAPFTDAALRFTPGTGDAEYVQFSFDQGCDVRLDRLRCEDGAPVYVALRDPYGEQELVIDFVDGGGRRATVVLAPDRPRARLGTLVQANATLEGAAVGSPDARWASSPFLHWLVTGIEHVWTGLDHLAFIVGLWLVAGSLRARVYAATAFTVGHSATLALAVLGGVSLPSGSVEACIALSVVLLAREALQTPGTTEPRRAAFGIEPELGHRLASWGVGFGLLHGLGFAGALQASALGMESRALGLLAFNLGVEVGQLAVLLACSAVVALAAALTPASSTLQVRARRYVAWSLGSLAAMWFVQRALSVVQGAIAP